MSIHINKTAVVATSHFLEGPYVGGIHYFYRYFKTRNYDVTFITQPLSPRLFLTDLGDFYKKLWHTRSSRDHIIHFTPVYPQSIFGPFRKYLFDYYLKLPFFNIKNVLKKFNLTKPDIFFCEATLALSLRLSVEPKKYIVRFSDSMTDLGHKKDIVDFCTQKSMSADLILVAAAGIKEELIDAGIDKSKINVLANGVDISDYEKKLDKPTEYENLSGPIAVYVGNLDIIDHVLLRNAASQLPYVNFFIIGPCKDQLIKNSPKNLNYIGYVLPKLVPSYLQHATIGIVPIRVQRWGVMERPRKIYQYLAAGIPTVSTKGKYSLPTSYVQYAETEQQFINSIQDTINSKSNREDIFRYAKTNFSWDAIYKQLDELIQNI